MLLGFPRISRTIPRFEAILISAPDRTSSPMLLQYANGRSQLPAPTIAVTSGGEVTTPRTLWFALQGCNPIGCNLLSDPIQVTIAANQKATVTLPAILDGESWDSFVLSASETNTPSSFVAIARIEPETTIELSTNAQLTLSAIVANPAALPTTSLLPGMRRGVSSLAQVFEYDPTSLLPQNNQTVLSAAPAPGNWLIVAGFSTYVANVDDPGGCAQDVRSIDESVVQLKTYNCNGSSGDGFRFWLINDSDDAISAGKRVMIAVTLNEMPRSGLFEGLLRCVFRGYVNTITGVLRVEDSNGDPMRGIDTEVLFENQKTDLMLEDDLQPDEAYAIDIYPAFTPEQLDNQILNGSLIKINLGLAVQAGAYVEGGFAKGDQIYPEYDRAIVIPQAVGAKCLKRSGLVNSRSFLAVSPSLVLGLAQNTLNQPLYINSNGSVYLKPLDEPQDDTEAIRAKIGTAAGISSASEWSDPVTFGSGAGLKVTCTYPSNGTIATVRANYPDPLIAGNTQSEFNPPFAVIYVRSTVASVATIKKFDGYLVTDAASQEFTIDNWSAGETISSIPVADEDFSLFEAISATPETLGSGTIPAGTIEVCFAYEYDGAQVTSISHSTLDGCLHTRTLTDAEVEASSRYWTEPLATREALRSIPQVQVSSYQARYLKETESPWWFNPESIEDESDRVIRPSWRTPEQPGRWIQSVSNRILTPDAIPTGTAGIGDVAIVLKTDTEDPDHGKVYEFESSGWTFKAILRGQRGEAGARGSIIIFETPPTSGTPGDLDEIGFVLNPDPDDVDNGKVYRKESSGWTLIGNLRGDGGSSGGSSNVLSTDAIAPALASNELFLSIDTDDDGLYPFLEDELSNRRSIAMLDRVQLWTKAQRYGIGLEYDEFAFEPVDGIRKVGDVYTIDAAYANIFELELRGSDTDVSIEVVNGVPGTRFELYLTWDDSDAPRSLAFPNDFQWLDRPLAPDFTAENSTRSRVSVVYTGSDWIASYTPLLTVSEPFEPETVDLLDRFTGYYSNVQQNRINTLIKTLKEADLWVGSSLFIFAAAHPDDARQFWTQSNLLNSTSNTFTQWRGITTDDPMPVWVTYNGVQTLGLWTTYNDAQSGTDLGVEIIDSSAYDQASILRFRNSSDQVQGRAIGRSDVSIASPINFFDPAWISTTRYPQGANQANTLFLNGSEIASDTQLATSFSGTSPEFVLGGSRRVVVSPASSTIVDPIVREYSAFFASNQALTPEQHKTLYRAMQKYLSSLPGAF